MPTYAHYHLHKFHGGIHLDTHKSESTQLPIQKLPIPPILSLPLTQRAGLHCKPLVAIGDKVCKGQIIADNHHRISTPIHAPTSGTIIDIAKRPIAHPSALAAPCIILQTDDEDRWSESHQNTINDYRKLDSHGLRKCIRNAGIVGLGGAAFPSAIKLHAKPEIPLHTLIVNGVECEPYITCDDMLMRERSIEVINGIKILRDVLRIKNCLIALEDDMPTAFEAMRTALDSEVNDGIQIIKIPVIYPAGGERQLIKILLGKEVKHNEYPLDMGVLCLNVATVEAVFQAVTHSRPLLSRIITITGPGINKPCNIEALLGTDFSLLVEACGGYTADVDKLVLGGPMMGFALHNDNLPVTKATNCILATTRQSMPRSPPAMPCIRCMECVRVCPANLLPQELYWHANAGNFEKAQEYDLFDCIECGCCSHICPSNIPLVDYYRFAKDQIDNIRQEKLQAQLARDRYESRQLRLMNNQKKRQQHLQTHKTTMLSDEARRAVINQALDQAKAKKQPN